MTAGLRRLRSKSNRHALFVLQAGRCAICGARLDPDNWHADHKRPWCQTETTNVHDMQAVCPSCNLRKGACMLRQHQEELRQWCERIARQRDLPRRIVCDVVPGGGKGSLPLVVASRLIPSVVDKVAVVVPREALREQAADAFKRGAVRRALEPRALEIRESVNDIDPSRGTAGFATTYQALVADKDHRVRDELRRQRYALVLDEPHHLGEAGAFAEAVQPLVEHARVLVLTSGTFQRADERPIAILPYIGQGLSSKLKIDRDDPDYHWIRYGIADALRERAIIPIHFEHLDGAASYLADGGLVQSVPALGEDRQALYTALRTGYALELLDRCVSDWQGRRAVSSRAALLVVCSDITQATAIEKHLRTRMPKIHAERADSSDSKEAREAIRRFKTGAVDCLVTVAMAYEGLDVPRVTHVAALTHIRSVPWIVQMLARAWRYDDEAGAYEDQRAVAFVPDDHLMREAVRSINVAFDEARLRGASLQAPPREPWEEEDDPRTRVVPLSSKATFATASNGPGGESVPANAHAQIRAALDASGLVGRVTTLDAQRFLDALDHRAEEAAVAPAASEEPWDSMTPAQRETVLRQRASAHTARYERAAGLSFGTVNYRLRRGGWRPRDVMTEAELLKLLDHLQRHYPLGGE